jgi:hypothetical protein
VVGWKEVDWIDRNDENKDDNVELISKDELKEG